MVSMTGSVSAGEKIMATAAKNITKVCLELGGTQNLNVAMKAIKGLKFGETYINRENFEAMQGFHAGWRKSGIGGADGKHGLHEYLQTQVVYLQS